MSTDLVPASRFGSGIDRPTNIDEIWRYAEIFSKSGLFTDCQDAAKAAVKIIAGAELGIPPFQAMRGIDIIKGKTAINANLMATMVKASGNFDYQVREMTEEVCRLEFFERRGAETLLLGPSAFSMEDARKAGLVQPGGMFSKFARNMLFARAMSNGVRWYCPHVTSGAAYTPDELGEAIDEEGNMVRVASAPVRMTEATPPEAPPDPVQEAAAREAAERAEAERKAEEKSLRAAEAKMAFADFAKRADDCGFKSQEKPDLVYLAQTICKRDKPSTADLHRALSLPKQDWDLAIDDTHAALANAEVDAANLTPPPPDPTPAEAKSTMEAIAR